MFWAYFLLQPPQDKNTISPGLVCYYGVLATVCSLISFFSWIFYSEFHAPALPFLCCRWPNMDLQAATTRERPSSCCVPVKMHVLSVRLFYLTCEYLHVSLLLFLLCESDVFSETSDTSCGCECVHHWVWCVRINQTLALSLSLLFLWVGGFWEQTFFPSAGVGERLLSITVWWNAGLIRGPPMVLSQWQRVPGSECEAPDNPQTHCESSRAPSFKPLLPSLLFKHSAEPLLLERSDS